MNAVHCLRDRLSGREMLFRPVLFLDRKFRYRAGKAPEHTPVDLLKEVRPQLDEVQKSLIAELVGTAAVRTSKTCHADVAKAVGNYVSTHARMVVARSMRRRLIAPWPARVHCESLKRNPRLVNR
ncbi:MAG TPA: hypothetical protein VGM27_18720 [Acidobacteriaceae bacterium]